VAHSGCRAGVVVCGSGPAGLLEKAGISCELWKKSKPVYDKREGSYGDLKIHSFTVMYDREAGNGLISLGKH
jgi:hypothetical protein